MDHIEGDEKEIVLRDLKATDKLVLQTKHSVYNFTIIDPVEKRGLLSGGTAGEQQRVAVLVGTLTGNTSNFANDNPVVKMGDRVHFTFIEKDEVQNVFTSEIQGLAHLKGSEGEDTTIPDLRPPKL